MSDLAPAVQDAVDRLAYSPGELAASLGVTRQHINNLIARGEIPSVKLGRRRLIPARAVAALLEQGADDAA
jgi:excisionase family DNA binding protein